jgi:hypothetical protein
MLRRIKAKLLALKPLLNQPLTHLLDLMDFSEGTLPSLTILRRRPYPIYILDLVIGFIGMTYHLRESQRTKEVSPFIQDLSFQGFAHFVHFRELFFPIEWSTCINYGPGAAEVLGFSLFWWQ